MNFKNVIKINLVEYKSKRHNLKVGNIVSIYLMSKVVISTHEYGKVVDINIVYC